MTGLEQEFAPYDWRKRRGEKWTPGRVKSAYRMYLQDQERSIPFKGLAAGYFINNWQPPLTWVKVVDHKLVDITTGPGWKSDDGPPGWLCVGPRKEESTLFLHPRKMLVRGFPWYYPPEVSWYMADGRVFNRGILKALEGHEWTEVSRALNDWYDKKGDAFKTLEQLVFALDNGNEDLATNARARANELLMNKFLG